MARTQLDSNTYGIGELITQRKLLEVPIHQRDYSWGDLEIEQYLMDIYTAFEAYQSDYFIGLVVLQGPIGGTWRVLDGQQRLATTTMIYSSIRIWLIEHGLVEDGKQIETEYLGVRQLGGNFSSRLRLNENNRDVFDEYIVRFRTIDEIKAASRAFARNGSNRSLLEGSLIIREWISNFCSKLEGDVAAKARKLFEFSSFIETRVQVVCVDVAEDFDPYILFESLNDRGAELTALDLVKNYVFGAVDMQDEPVLKTQWERMARLIEGRNADDFLKVFWTSHFGVVQKSDLYRKIRFSYPESEGALRVTEDLAHAAEVLSRLENTRDEFWRNYPPQTIDYLKQLEVIGSKLVRPVLLAAIKRFSAEDFAHLLWVLVVVLVRYQMVGKGRTGVLEKTLGTLAQGINSLNIQSLEAVKKNVGSILPDDNDFTVQVARHMDTKLNRMIYLLAGIDLCISEGRSRQIYGRMQQVKFVHQVMPISGGDEKDDSDLQLLTLGNLFLVEEGRSNVMNWEETKGSIFPTTRMLAEAGAEPTLLYIMRRSLEFGRHASKVWSLEGSEHV